MVGGRATLGLPKKLSGMHRCIPENPLRTFLGEFTSSSSSSWLLSSSLPFYSPLIVQKFTPAELAERVHSPNV
jgi:hypothetical protein